MRDLPSTLRPLLGTDRPFALATAVAVEGSAPRPVGTVMAIDADGQIFGGLSGGCVEGTICDLADEVLAGGSPTVHRFESDDGDPFTVGLICGGALDVLVQRVDATAATDLAELVSAVDQQRPVTTALVVAGDAPLGARLVVTAAGRRGSLGDTRLDTAVERAAQARLDGGEGVTTLHYGLDGDPCADDVTVLMQSIQPPPRLLLFGATDFAAALVSAAAPLGYAATVCDPREAFATAGRFPGAEVVRAWPHRYFAETVVDARTAVCVLSHDEKVDIPLLELALRSPVAYVGAMGSRRTHDERVRRLRERGLGDRELTRLRSPIGLDIGASTAEETAVSVVAEIVQQRRGGSGRPLSSVAGPIHHPVLHPAMS